jgi:hypothetical protein
MYREPATETRSASSRPDTGAFVDPRVAKHGGTRRNDQANYDFPGMTDQSPWRRSSVHKATRFYGCALCGQKFTGPHAVYTHLAKVHDR